MTPLCQIEFILSKGKLILISNNNIDNIKVWECRLLVGLLLLFLGWRTFRLSTALLCCNNGIHFFSEVEIKLRKLSH